MTFNGPQAPTKTTWANGEAAVNDALQLEKKVNGKLLDLHWTAQQVNDPHVSIYIHYCYFRGGEIRKLNDLQNTNMKVPIQLIFFFSNRPQW